MRGKGAPHSAVDPPLASPAAVVREPFGSRLRRLDLSHVSLGGRIATWAARLLASHAPLLEDLDLSFCRISSKAAAPLWEPLVVRFGEDNVRV